MASRPRHFVNGEGKTFAVHGIRIRKYFGRTYVPASEVEVYFIVCLVEFIKLNENKTQNINFLMHMFVQTVVMKHIYTFAIRMGASLYIHLRMQAKDDQSKSAMKVMRATRLRGFEHQRYVLR